MRPAARQYTESKDLGTLTPKWPLSNPTSQSSGNPEEEVGGRENVRARGDGGEDTKKLRASQHKGLSHI